MKIPEYSSFRIWLLKTVFAQHFRSSRGYNNETNDKCYHYCLSIKMYYLILNFLLLSSYGIFFSLFCQNLLVRIIYRTIDKTFRHFLSICLIHDAQTATPRARWILLKMPHYGWRLIEILKKKTETMFLCVYFQK